METLFALAASPQCGIVVLLSKKRRVGQNGWRGETNDGHSGEVVTGRARE